MNNDQAGTPKLCDSRKAADMRGKVPALEGKLRAWEQGVEARRAGRRHGRSYTETDSLKRWGGVAW